MMGNKGMPGGFLSVSANGPDDGILWAAIPYKDDAWVEIVRGTLRAFDANTLATALEHRRQRAGRQLRFRQVRSAHRRQRQSVSPNLFRSPECVRAARAQRRPHAHSPRRKLSKTRAIAAMSKAPPAIRDTTKSPSLSLAPNRAPASGRGRRNRLPHHGKHTTCLGGAGGFACASGLFTVLRER